VKGKRFRFRAQAALDLRQREYDAARRVLAKAEADLREAERLSREATQCADQARAQCAARMQEPGGLVQQQWYRSWILKLDRDRALAAKAAAARASDVARAATECTRSRQRVESLERFKEKALREWERETLAEEQKHIDALATMRFTTAARDAGTRNPEPGSER
jgi:flagellar export protein FliJ